MSQLEEKIKNAPVQYFALAGVLIAGLYYTNFYDGGARYENQINQLKPQIQTLRTEVADVENLTSNMQQYETELNSLAEKFEMALNYLPSRENIYVIIQQLYLEARNNGVNITSVKPSDKFLEQDFYQAMPIAIEFSGTYDQIMGFITKIVNLPRIINLKELTMTLDNKQSPSSAIIKAKGIMYAYRFKEELVNGPQGAPAK